MTDRAAPARLYIAFDDTDTLDADRGTGKVGRWFEDELPDGCRLWAVIRQQLLVHPDVPYTSHNCWPTSNAMHASRPASPRASRAASPRWHST